jgi:hypothetical protein
MNMRNRDDLEKYLGYYTKAQPSESGLRVAALLEEWLGLHHIVESALKRVDWMNPRYQIIKLCKHQSPGGLSSFDFDALTQLVFMAHDHCIRVQLGPCNPQHMELVFHPRRSREGGTSRRHPTLEQAVAQWREHHNAIYVPAPAQEAAGVSPALAEAAVGR